MNLSSLSLSALLQFVLLAVCQAGVRPLPLCPGDRPSTVYRLTADGVETPVAFERFNGNFRFHVAAVETDGPVRMTLSAPSVAVDKMRIRPRRWNIAFERREHEADFSLQPHQKLVVEIPGQRPLLLFAIPPESNPPSSADNNVVYYGPGEHDAGRIRLRSGQTLYLAAGARVRGTVYAFEANDVAIRGRGVLDARGLTDADKRIHGILFERCKNITVEGIQLRTGDWWQSNFLLCNNVRISHLHTLSFGKNNDGVDIDGVTDFRIADSFLGCGDDGFGWHALDATAFGEPPTKDCIAERCVIWNEFDGNGLRIGASMETERFENIVFRDIDVLHAARNAVMVDHSDWAHVHNVLFERFDNDTPRLLAKMIILKGGYSNHTGYRDARGRVSQVAFRDCSTSGEGVLLKGADPGHGISGVRFVNCTRQGRPFADADVQQAAYVSDVSCEDKPFEKATFVDAPAHIGQASSPAELVIDDGDEQSWALAGAALHRSENPDCHDGDCWIIDSLGWGRAAAFAPQVNGKYEVAVHWGTHRDVATRAPWTVRHRDGYTTTVLDQNNSPGWKSLGVFQLEEGSWVRLADPHYQVSNGPVVADAIRFRRVVAGDHE